jgi:tripartite-type tricarboxylate transporter receptor subunit TctC
MSDIDHRRGVFRHRWWHPGPRMAASEARLPLSLDRRARLKRRALVLCVAMVAAPVTACASSGGSGSPVDSGGVQAGRAFFKGKTITYIVPGKPGNAQSGIMLALRPYMEKYLGATINIQYTLNGSNSIGQDKVQASTPDGLTIGTLLIASNLSAVFAKAPTVDFAQQNAAIIGATTAVPDLVVACGGSPFKTFEDVVTNKAPQKTLEVSGVRSTLFLYLLQKAYGYTGSYLSGYAGEDQEPACARGDGALAASAVPDFVSADLKSPFTGTAPLLLSTPINATSPAAWLNSAVPLLNNFVKQHPPKDPKAMAAAINLVSSSAPQYGFFAPPGVPANRLQALQDAMKYAAAQPAAKQGYIKYTVNPGYVSPSTAVAYIKSQLKLASYYQQVTAAVTG